MKRTLLILACVFLCAASQYQVGNRNFRPAAFSPPPAGAVSYAGNGCYVYEGGGYSVTCTISGITAGQSILVSSTFLTFGNPGPLSIVDSSTSESIQTLVPTKSWSNSDWIRAEFLIYNTTPGTHTITINSGSNGSLKGMVASVLDHVASVDVSSTYEVTGAPGVLSCTPVTTSVANEFIMSVGAINQQSYDLVAGIIPQTMTLADRIPSPNGWYANEYGIAVTAGSNYTQFTMATTSALAFCDTFAFLPSTAGPSSGWYEYAADNFAYAASPSCNLSGNWTSVNNGAVSMKTAGGGCYGTLDGFTSTGGGYEGWAYWNAVFFRPNQYSQATYHTISSGDWIILNLHVNGGAGYSCLFLNGASQILKWTDSTNWGLSSLTTSPATINDGDIIRAEITGSTISCKVNGTEIMNATDTSYPSGAAGIGAYTSGGTSIASNWSAGSNTPYVAPKDAFTVFPTSATAANRTDTSGHLGYSFIPSVNMQISKLGRLSISVSGSAGHNTAIWDTATGTAITSCWIDNSYLSDSHGFKYCNNTPVDLIAGHEYVIATDENSLADPWLDTWVTTGHMQSEINVTADRYTYSYSSFPAAIHSGPNSYTAVTFVYTPIP